MFILPDESIWSCIPGAREKGVARITVTDIMLGVPACVQCSNCKSQRNCVPSRLKHPLRTRHGVVPSHTRFIFCATLHMQDVKFVYTTRLFMPDHGGKRQSARSS